MLDHLTVKPSNYDPANNSKLSYDGELIPAADALARYERDEQIRQKYAEAAASVEDLQLTWDDVDKKLSQDLYK